MAQFDYLYSLAYYDYNKLVTDLSDRVGFTIGASQIEQLSESCSSRSSLYYYCEDGSSDSKKKSCSDDKWFFIPTSWCDDNTKERVWLAHFNYGKKQKNWTYIGAADINGLLEVCYPFISTNGVFEDSIEKMLSDLRVVDNTLGAVDTDGDEYYRSLASERVKRLSKKMADSDLIGDLIDKGTETKDAKKTTRRTTKRTTSATSATKKSPKTKTVTSKEVDEEQGSITSEVTSVGIDEKTVVENTISEQTATESQAVIEEPEKKDEKSIIMDASSSNVDEEPVSYEFSDNQIDIFDTEGENILSTGEFSTLMPSRNDVFKKLSWRESSTGSDKFVQDFVSFLDKTCVFASPRAVRVYMRYLVVRLSKYIDRVGIEKAKEMRYVALSKTNGVAYNKAVFSTGLKDICGDTIYVISDFDPLCKAGTIRFSNLGVLISKSQLLQYKFDSHKLQLRRVPFWNKPEECLFTASIEAIDFTDKSRFVHCLEERGERVVDEMKAMSFSQCCKDLKNAVIDAVARNEIDSTYIKPFYEVSSDTIGYVIPYYVGQNTSKKPKLAILLCKNDGFWKIMTILPMSVAYCNVLLLSPYTRDWDAFL